MTGPPALDISHLSYTYGDRRALDDVSLQVAPGEIFGLLGPNGGGKTTLFRIVSTLLPIQQGSVRVFGDDVASQAAAARRRMGVVFQSPALDIRLTVLENLRHHGHLYGLHGATLRDRMADVLARVRLQDRARDLVQTLSGGQRRRVEVAKAMLPNPALLVLDEPSTGLDPSARRDLGDDLRGLRDRAGTTVVLTTHLMDEAAGCDRVAILHEGRLVALGTPAALTAEVGGDIVQITTREPQALAEAVRARFAVEPRIVDGQLRIERPRAHEFVPQLVEAFPGAIDAVTFGKPTLEDVFVRHTGRRLE
ncbi:MAG: ABC transporter ATP-binding protein [Acidobacteriota bacterium]|nr:ABC transporter ATP-binding protein [Acidobacteriota bacterium]